MLKPLLPILFAMLIAPAHAQSAPAPLPADWTAATVSRSARFEISSRHTGQRYRIQLGLPLGPAPAAGYPVLWALDGGASFSAMEAFRLRDGHEKKNPGEAWRERAAGPVHDGLIVAIGYASDEAFDVDARALDYTPLPEAPAGDRLSTRHGGADAFIAFLTDELRPLLAAHFAMDPQRHTLFGFSYGGLLTLHVLSTQPRHFQRYWAASPSLWFAGHQTLNALPARLKTLDFTQAPVRLTLTVGHDEQYPARFATPQVREKLQARRMVDNVARFGELLRDAKGIEVTRLDLPGRDHYDMFQHGARHVQTFAFAP